MEPCKILFKYFMGELRSAALLISISARLIYSFGAHLAPKGSHLYDKGMLKHHARDLFWVCYSFDKDLAHKLGQPPTMTDDCCDLTFPINYVQMQTLNIHSNDIYSNCETTTVPLYPWDLRLSIIKSKIYMSLYSVNALGQPGADILRRTRLLDKELEDWRQSLHVEFRPSLSFSEQTPIHCPLNTQSVMLRLSYYHCIILIHQARRRVNGGKYAMPNAPWEDESADLELLVSASRSILLYLQKALPVVEQECFW